MLAAFAILASACGAGSDSSQGLAERSATGSGTTSDPTATETTDPTTSSTTEEAPTTETSETSDGNTSEPPSETTESTTTANSSTNEIEFLISETGIGSVEAGMTVEEMIEALGPGFDVSFEQSVRVDVDAYKIARAGQVIMYAAEIDPGVVNILFTNSIDAAIESGIGPGSRLAEVVELHGAPILGYNTESESREGVSFADGTGGSDSRITFETLVQAGIYANPIGGFNETGDYRPEGRIGYVSVTCFPSGPRACTIAPTGPADLSN